MKFLEQFRILHLDFYSFKKGGGYIGFGLSVIPFVCSFVRPFVRRP